MPNLEKQLETSRNRMADLRTDYFSVLEFVDKMEHLGQLQDRLDITCDTETIWRIFSREIQLLAAAEVCALFMVDPSTHDFVLHGATPPSAADMCRREMEMQIECGTFSWIINRRQPSIIPSLAFREDRTVIVLPLSTARKTLGSVMLLTPIQDSAITHETLRLLGMIARQCSLVMENSQLYDSLKKEHESLKEAQEQVLQAEKMASMGRLTAGAFHEILNPMNIISGYVQLMRMKSSGESGFDHYLSVMEEQVQRVADIVRELLQFSQFSRKKVVPLRVGDLVQKVLKLMQHEIGFDNIAIECHMDPALPMVLGESESLSQVFMNLLSNAGDAMKEGGKLVISAHTVPNGEGRTRDGCMVEILFRDNGCGISEKNHSRIFDPFFSTKEAGEKTGLGLSTSYRIVKEHGGYIRAESTRDIGTTFIVGLPAAAAEQPSGAGAVAEKVC